MNKTGRCILIIVIKLKNKILYRHGKTRTLFVLQGEFMTVILAAVSASITGLSDQHNIQRNIACT